MTTAVSQDHVNDVLNSKGYAYSCTEQEEVNLRDAFKALQRDMGPEKFRDEMCKVFEQNEEYLRGLGDPNHPALLALEEWRSDKAGK